jgi:peroxiredoxin
MFRLKGLRLGALLLTANLIVSIAPTAEAGKFNKKIKIGDSAPSYVGLPGVDGKSHSLADEKDKDVVVLVFTCNQCPVATAYEKRIMDFTKKYGGPGGKVAVVAINVNTDPEDSLPSMIERAKERGFNFPFLYDERQKVGRALGATVTPEFFVLDKNRKVVYMGGMDNGVNPNNVTANYLVPAVEAALKGVAPAVSETAARGCNILYQRK